jgi:hypothetical protein
MMRHPYRSPLLASLGAMLVAGALPARAQQRVEVTTRAGTRARSTSTQQLRMLQQRADSLARVYNDADELSLAERRRVGEQLDRTVEQIELLTARLAGTDGDGSDAAAPRVWMTPTTGSRSQTFMRRALAESKGVKPRGWIGVDISGPAREPRVENGDLIVRYLAHPAIVSVEPNSPAERAGLAPRDTLIAYDGYDLRDSDVPITRLLTPNKRVLVRIRRDGRTMDVPVTIADVPSRIAIRREMSVEYLPRTTPLPGVAFPRAAMAPLPPGRAMVARVPQPTEAPMPPSVVMTPMAPMPPAGEGFAMGGVAGVAGAQLVALTEGLSRALGVRRGVLVTNAPVSSPAYQSGLRDGDVITRADGAELVTVSDLRQRVAIAANNGEHSVALELVRAKKTRKESLRW